MNESSQSMQTADKHYPAEVLVFGSGACAERIGANLSQNGVKVWLVPPNGHQDPGSVLDSGFETLPNVQFFQCRGFAGQFDVVLKQNGQTLMKRPAAIVVAQEGEYIPNYDTYGLTPSQQVCTLSQLEQARDPSNTDLSLKKGARVVFLNSWQQESHPVITGRMLAQCLRLQKQATASTYFLTGNLKVAADGLEARYQEAKSAGTLFMKFDHRFPQLKQTESGAVQIEYWDDISRMPFTLTADLVVVDESFRAHDSLSALAAGLGIDHDAAGFLQSDNVHRLGNGTNRRGIFVAGGARGIFSDDEQLEDADQVSLNVMAFLCGRDREALPKVEIDTGRCARCLTCFRLCPHGAISLQPTVTVVPQACQSCGTCAAACPGRAIAVEGLDIGNQTQEMTRSTEKTSDAKDFIPRLVAFCCARSAARARELAHLMGHSIPRGMRFVDTMCGGSISTRHLLYAFDAGADGVIVMTCHTDNCHSEKGNQHARKRVDTGSETLKMMGIAPERLELITLASNMGSEFARRTHAFANKIKELGPLEEGYDRRKTGSN